MSADHTARPESWGHITRHDSTNPYADCLLELRARVERLEQAQQQAEPAGDQTLHSIALRMVDTLANLDVLPEITDTIRQAIREPMAPPAPSTPAGQGELVGSVAEAMGGEDGLCDWTPEARAAILAVADWCDGRGMDGAADWIRREVGR